MVKMLQNHCEFFMAAIICTILTIRLIAALTNGGTTHMIINAVYKKSFRYIETFAGAEMESYLKEKLIGFALGCGALVRDQRPYLTL